MFDRVRVIAEEAVLVGVKWAIIAALVLCGVGYALGDYALTRQKAEQGAQAFQFIQAQLASQKATQGAK